MFAQCHAGNGIAAEAAGRARRTNIDQYNRTFQKVNRSHCLTTPKRPSTSPALHRHRDRRVGRLDDGGHEQRRRIYHQAGADGARCRHPPDSRDAATFGGRHYRVDQGQLPARISFRVASKVDSRTILDANGSNRFLAAGHVVLACGIGAPQRMHGPFVTEDEITAVCDHWRSQAKAVYNERLLEAPKDENTESADGEPGADDVDDTLYQEAVRVVCEAGRASTSDSAATSACRIRQGARLIDIMEKDGIVGPADGTKPREVLKGKEWMREFDASMK